MKNRQVHPGWDWTMKRAAVGTIIAVVCAYSLPSGLTRSIAFAALPFFIFLFLFARAKARPNEDFQDTPWGI